ncbi:dethiobiotin synthase [Pigmentiphaga soli]|uniref:dethiobiotin synthase n=1 Tax=Pigmentiphaga soli TaxID=1007095 RepID=UPI0031ED9FC2
MGRRFGRAARDYDAHAEVQRAAAERLAQAIAGLPLPARPRILEVGCGTGLLTQALARRIGAADWTITDISPGMLAAARGGPPLPGTARFMQLDGEHPCALAGERFDLVCSSLAAQWFGDLDAGLARLGGLLRPGGHLAVSTLAAGTFGEWRRAHEALGLAAATPHYPAAARIGRALPRMTGRVQAYDLVQAHADGLAFLRGLRAIGATVPAAGARPLGVAELRRVLARFEAAGATATYRIAQGLWRRAAHTPRGVFVTGTDTGIGKTLTSAVLVRAWQADYWKPLQTGIADEPGDSDTVTRLAGLAPGRLHAPASVLRAPLSPWAAAREEGAAIDAAAIEAPATAAPLVVEGAGGLFVPIDDDTMMIDLICRLDLPVVLVARSTLGTINHTLLSLEALRRRGAPVAGVVLSGPRSPGNREAIERFGGVRVLAEIPALERVDGQVVAELATAMPDLAACLAAAGR